MPQHTAFHIAVAGRESRTEYSCTASVAPGRSSVAQRPQLGVGVGEVADQVRGEDAVERAVDAGVGEALDAGCARTGPMAGHGLACASSSIPAEASTATISACGATLSNAAVDAPVPQPASSSRSPRPCVGQPHRCAEFAGGAWYPGFAPTSRS